MTNPYIQKLPSNLRNCLVAKIPTLWIIVDFAQTGLVVQIVCLPSTITQLQLAKVTHLPPSCKDRWQQSVLIS